MDQRPVGVFDSGVGGLTAVRELRKLLPSETLYTSETHPVCLMAAALRKFC